MNLGLWGCRADDTGLGVQTYNAYKYLKPSKTAVIDIQELNGNPTYHDRYSNATFIYGIPNKQDILDWATDLDVIMAFETPYNYQLFEVARARGIKTILQPNWEFFDYSNRPTLPKPDLLALPSRWHSCDFIAIGKQLGIQVEYLPVPIDRAVLPYKQRTHCRYFLHVAGKKTFMDRNGTDIFLGAIPYVKSNVRFIIRSQQDLRLPNDKRIMQATGEVRDYHSLYNKGDVLVLPRKYGGLCLPLNEALSVGMIPLMTNTQPQSDFLDEYSLVEPLVVSKIMTRSEIDCAETTPQRLAHAIDRLAKLDTNMVKHYSMSSNNMASLWDWETMLPIYMKVMHKLCTT